MPTLYLIRGLPGAGKSTLAESLTSASEDTYGTIHIEADMWFEDFNEGVFDASKLKQAHEHCQNVCRGALAIGLDCIVSNTSTTEAEVKTYQDIAERCGAEFISMIVENRHGNKSIHDVPESTMQKMRQRFSVKL
jgi:predicted kinase